MYAIINFLYLNNPDPPHESSQWGPEFLQENQKIKIKVIIYCTHKKN